MKSLKKQRRIQIVILALGAVVAVLVTLSFLPEGAFQLFRSPTEVLAQPPSPAEYFQIGGLVKEGTITPTVGTRFEFVVTDGASDVPVVYVGADPAPDLFKEGQGTIAKGYYIDGRFEASELLARHDETYMPAEVVDALKEQGVYQGDET